MVYIPVLRKKIPGNRHDRNHLPWRCILHPISLSLKQVEAKPEGLRPLTILVPVDQHNQLEKWHHKVAAQVPLPKQFPSFKNDTKSEPGIKCFDKIYFRVPSCLRLFDVSCRNVTAWGQNPY
jgi:hypothetical protein